MSFSISLLGDLRPPIFHILLVLNIDDIGLRDEFAKLKQQAEDNADQDAQNQIKLDNAKKHMSGSAALKEFFGGLF